MLQSTFQTVQLTAAAEIDTYNPQIYVIEENTVMVSASHPFLWVLESRTGIPLLTSENAHCSHTYVYTSFLLKF